MNKNREIQVEFIDIAKDIQKEGFSDEMLLDKIILHSTQYEKIFNTTLKKYKYRPWKIGIVEITNPEVNISILRRFFGKSTLGLNDSHFFIPKYSQNILGIKNKKQKFLMKKGNSFIFYWQHPSDNLRVTFKATVILAIIGIVITILLA